MHPAEIVVRDVKRDGGLVVLKLLREGVGQAGEAPAGHPKREILASPDRYSYEHKIVERFGGQHELELVVPAPPPALPAPSTEPEAVEAEAGH